MCVLSVKKTSKFCAVLTIGFVLQAIDTASCSAIDLKSASQKTSNSFNASIEGRWIGQTQTNSGDIIGVTLDISPIQVNKVSAILIYGGKRSFTLEGTYQGESNNRSVFSLCSKNGGLFCDKPSKMTVWKATENALFYSVSSRDNKIQEEGTLSKRVK
ncbi:MAG: hypothetical protein WCK85_07480 [Chlorobium sp.]